MRSARVKTFLCLFSAPSIFKERSIDIHTSPEKLFLKLLAICIAKRLAAKGLTSRWCLVFSTQLNYLLPCQVTICSWSSRIFIFENPGRPRSEEHTSELQSRLHLVCRLLL